MEITFIFETLKTFKGSKDVSTAQHSYYNVQRVKEM